ncbi:type I-E CRISPR-associated protein Cse1/CasA [Streptomyces sp. 184]|uniref:type I-E CRISPR-associated protein Cse1/CasA n=1 Tax=Streptomyces sp. 184 TaxID=1827526 RepID=UPI003891F409
MYDLLDEEWQPALGAADGRIERVGLLRLLTASHSYADLLTDVPTQLPALYRQLLLPFVVDALDGLLPHDPDGWAALFRGGRFTDRQAEALLAYGDEHRHRFGLFDPDRPFAQVPGLSTAKGETRSASALVATAAQGNNVPLFSSRTDGDELRLEPGAALRWLLHTHCWDTGAIKTGVLGDDRVKQGKTTGNPVGPLGRLGVVMPLGRTVFETLMLNIPFKKRVLSQDAPQWRRGDATDHPCAVASWTQRPPLGLLDLWTWQARRVLLLPDGDGDGHGGSGSGPCVTRVVVAGGDRLELTPDDEPHTAWLVSSRTTAHGGRGAAAQHKEQQKKKPPSPLPAVEDGQGADEFKKPRKHPEGKSGWRGLDALLAFAHAPDVARTPQGDRPETTQLLATLAEARDDIDPEYPLRLHLTGTTYGKKLTHVEDSFHDEVPLPLAALRHDGPVRRALLEAVLHAEDLADAVNRLESHLRRASGADPLPYGAWQQPGERLLALLEPLVLGLLHDLRRVGDDDEAGCDDRLAGWEREALRAAWQVSEQLLMLTTPGVVAGRRVVMRDGSERVFSLSHAEAGFQRAVRGILRRLPVPAGTGAGAGAGAGSGPGAGPGSGAGPRAGSGG